MTAYYNEIDPYAAQWIRNLIAAGHIAAGDVDERSIEDVKPDELMGYTQCHFFAGAGVWSCALRQAGWPDDRQAWTGSCPCQPFSTAGKGAGFDDERHLWPHFQWLIQQCQPATVFGEQVASKTTEPWIDLVHADLEAMDYSFGCVPFPSAGVGAPHIRDRAYWVAYSGSKGLSQQRREWHEPPRPSSAGLSGGLANANSDEHGEAGRDSTGDSQTVQGVDWTQKPRAGMPGGAGDSLRGMADTEHDEREGSLPRCVPDTETDGGRQTTKSPRHCEIRRLADTGKHGRIEGGITATRARHGDTPDTDGGFGRPSPTNGFWTDVDWLLCRDGKWRCVESGTFPLAHGAASRVGRNGSDWKSPAGGQEKAPRAGRLKAYGNAINAAAAESFIGCVMEVIGAN